MGQIGNAAHVATGGVGCCTLQVGSQDRLESMCCAIPSGQVAGQVIASGATIGEE